MNLTPTWSIASDDDYSQHSFVSDGDSEFDLSPATRYPDERRSVSALRKLANNRQEPPVTRSRAKAIGRATLLPRSMSKERRRSNIRQSLDSFTSKAMMLTNSIFVPKRHTSDYPVPQSPTDSVNSLTNRLESWTLDEMNSTGRWPSEKTTSHGMRQINPFSFTASAASSLFDAPQSHLWSHCPLAAAIPQTDWQPNLFTSPNTSTFPINSNNHVTTASNKPSSHPRPHRAKHTFSKAFSTLIIFAIGLVLGYLLTNTIPPDLAVHWLLTVWNRCAQLTIAWVPLVHLYLQPVLKNCSSFLLI